MKIVNQRGKYVFIQGVLDEIPDSAIRDLFQKGEAEVKVKDNIFTLRFAEEEGSRELLDIEKEALKKRGYDLEDLAA